MRNTYVWCHLQNRTVPDCSLTLQATGFLFGKVSLMFGNYGPTPWPHSLSFPFTYLSHPNCQIILSFSAYHPSQLPAYALFFWTVIFKFTQALIWCSILRRVKRTRRKSAMLTAQLLRRSRRVQGQSSSTKTRDPNSRKVVFEAGQP